MTNEEARNEFDRLFRNFIPNDIRRALDDAKANYLAALGLLSYTEILGGFISGNGARTGHAARNFKAALQRFPSEYGLVDKALVVIDADGKQQTGIYSIVRCGLVHEYGVKAPSIVYASSDGVAKPDRYGVAVVTENGRRVIEINCHEYARDFQVAVDSVWADLAADNEPRSSNLINVLERLDKYTVK
jgi:hypothetical protein